MSGKHAINPDLFRITGSPLTQKIHDALQGHDMEDIVLHIMGVLKVCVDTWCEGNEKEKKYLNKKIMKLTDEILDR